MKCCYQSDYSNEKITWLEKEGATQLKIIMHSGADHNGDFGKITEKYSSEGNPALFNSEILISSPAWSNDYNLVPDSMMKSANKLTQYGSRVPNPDQNTIHTSWQKTLSFWHCMAQIWTLRSKLDTGFCAEHRT